MVTKHHKRTHWHGSVPRCFAPRDETYAKRYPPEILRGAKTYAKRYPLEILRGINELKADPKPSTQGQGQESQSQAGHLFGSAPIRLDLGTRTSWFRTPGQNIRKTLSPGNFPRCQNIRKTLSPGNSPRNQPAQGGPETLHPGPRPGEPEPGWTPI